MRRPDEVGKFFCSYYGSAASIIAWEDVANILQGCCRTVVLEIIFSSARTQTVSGKVKREHGKDAQQLFQIGIFVDTAVSSACPEELPSYTRALHRMA